MMFRAFGIWRAQHLCSNCKIELTNFQKDHRRGICVHCGHNSKNEKECDHITVIRRKIRTGMFSYTWEVKE